MTKRGLALGAVALAVVATVTMAYAGSALQLYQGYGLRYLKHVNFNTGTGAHTNLLLQNVFGGDANVQIKIAARAVDGSNVSQSRTIGLRAGETRSLVFVWSKNITDLNFIQLLRLNTGQPN